MWAERTTTRGTLSIAIACLAALSVCRLYQVTSRFILHEPLAWSEALTRALMIWSVFMGLPSAFREGAMVAVDVLPEMLGRNRMWLVIPTTILTIALLCIASWFAWAVLPLVRFQTVSGLNITIAWIYASIPIGTTLAIPAVIAALIDDMTDREHDESVELGV